MPPLASRFVHQTLRHIVPGARGIAADAHYAAREMIREVRLAGGESLKVPGVVPKLSATPGGFEGGGPALGQHTDEVLHELGYDDAAIARLRAARVV